MLHSLERKGEPHPAAASPHRGPAWHSLHLATGSAHAVVPRAWFARKQRTVEGGHAVFSALENSTANAHHKLTTLPLPGIAAIGADTLWAATIHVSGDFSQASCDPDLTGECDLVAGLSDATTVWAVSRGATFLDTLVPFPDTANRPRTGRKRAAHLHFPPC